MWHKPVCAKCERDMTCAMTGVGVLDVTGSGEDYKITMGDKWRCNKCGCEVVTGFAQRVLMHHHEPGFADTIARLADDGRLIRAREAGRR